MELKNLNAIRDELDHLYEAANLLEIIRNCFDSHYDFRAFVEKHHKGFGNEILIGTRIDNYFNFDDSE